MRNYGLSLTRGELNFPLYFLGHCPYPQDENVIIPLGLGLTTAKGETLWVLQLVVSPRGSHGMEFPPAGKLLFHLARRSGRKRGKWRMGTKGLCVPSYTVHWLVVSHPDGQNQDPWFA